MKHLPPILLAVALLLAPCLAALPDDTTLMQTVWSSLLCVLVLAGTVLSPALKGRAVHKETPLKRAKGASSNPLSSAPEGVSLWTARPFRAGQSFAVLLALALCSLLLRLLIHHNIAYLGQMLRGWGVLAVEFALFALCRSLAQAGRGSLYLLTGAAVLGAAIISANGVGDYLLHFLAHQPGWREFSTSTPDFLAGYLILLLPITLSLFLAVPLHKASPLLNGLCVFLLGIVFLFSLMTLLTTGSRFALVSLAVGLVVFAVSLLRLRRDRTVWSRSAQARLAALVIMLLLPSAAFVKPVLSRLHSTTEGNSAAFRIWTWRGAAHMAVANPVLGTGVGTWIDTYPRYALTGFTRLAHNSYLQFADECGIPALLALVVTLGLVGAAGIKGLRTPQTETLPRKGDPVGRPALDASTNPLSAVAPADDRLLLGGLLASLAAGVVQNLIDSDWYVFFIVITFWAIAGLAVGISERTTTDHSAVPVSHRWQLAARVVAALLLVLFATQGVAAWFGQQAQTAHDLDTARSAYQTAQAWDPLNARYPAELGARVFAQTGDLAGAEEALRQAVRLEPGSTDYRRLGTILDAAGKHDQAAAAYQEGLRIDPNALDLLLALAKDSPPTQVLGVDRRIAALEDSPVGKVRAIGEVTEVKFAFADAALAAAAGKTPQAALYARRAQKVIEAYINEGGTLNAERQVQASGHADPAGDTEIRDLYTQVMAILAGASPPDQRTMLAAHAADYAMRFQAVIDAGQGETAQTTDEAATDYGQAADTLDRWAASAPVAPDEEKAGAQWYKQVMDSIIAGIPAGQRSTFQDREQTGLAKFAARFPTP